MEVKDTEDTGGKVEKRKCNGLTSTILTKHYKVVLNKKQRDVNKKRI